MIYLSIYNWSELGRRLVQSLAMIGLMYVIYSGTNWNNANYNAYLLIWGCELIAFGLFCLFTKEAIGLIIIEYKQQNSREVKHE